MRILIADLCRNLCSCKVGTSKKLLCLVHPLVCNIFCKGLLHILTEDRTEIVRADLHLTSHASQCDRFIRIMRIDVIHRIL